MRIFWLVSVLLLFAISAEARYVTVSWDAVATATSYKLYWGTTSGIDPADSDTYSYRSDQDNNFEGSLLITGLSYELNINEEPTYLVVTAYDGASESVASDELFFPYLLQDGYSTPEQISIYLPTDGYEATMTATMRYRKVGVVDWITGHDLWKLHDWTGEEGFAWIITGLDSGSNYEVEVTTSDGGNDVLYTEVMSTATLPPDAGPPTINITTADNQTAIEGKINGASAGDVIEFARGTYNVDGLTITVSGDEGNPIYIRGETRNSVTIQDSDGVVMLLDDSQNLVIENMTIVGSQIDSGVDASSKGIVYDTNGALIGNLVFRYLNITGTDMGVITNQQGKQLFVYETVLQGNNTWTQDFYDWGGGGPPGIPTPPSDPDIEENVMWNDDGIRLYGKGNAAWNNTIDGYGDSFAAADSGNLYDSESIHFYRNKITMTGDDAFELDNGHRNISVYDNHVTNTMTFLSYDQVDCGPYLFFRNIGINIGRQLLKGNSIGMKGVFLYNNTSVSTTNTSETGDVWSIIQYNYSTDYFSVMNNIFIKYNNTSLMAWEGSIPTAIDWEYNTLHPDGDVWWTNSGGSYPSLDSARSGLPATTNVFGSNNRHYEDLIEQDPFETPVDLTDDANVEVTTYYVPSLSGSSDSKNTGIAITGISDGYSGAAPDRGAIIDGLDAVTYGATVEISSNSTTGISATGVSFN